MKPKNEKKLTEEEIATVVGYYFKGQGWDLYPEVVVPVFPGRPDYVGVKGTLCAAVECKASLTYPVLEQLLRWPLSFHEAENCEYQDARNKGIPHLLFAVTGATSGRYSPLKEKLLRDHKVGHLEVRYEGPAYALSDQVSNGRFNPGGYAVIDGHRWRVLVRTEARIQPGSRRTAHRITQHLHQDMKTAQAGVTGKKANHMTPFRRTMEKARAALACYKQCHIVHLVEHINLNMGGHHYCSDRQALSSIGKFLIEFDMAERDEGVPVYWLKGRVPDGCQTALIDGSTGRPRQ